MPVVVTGASGAVGRALVPSLGARGSEVRAVVRQRSRAEELRSIGAKIAVSSLEDTDTLEAVMSGAHTVVHLAGGLDLPDDQAYEAANLGTTRDVVEAAQESGVARLIFVSYPGAYPDAANPYLRSKGSAEEVVRASGLQHVIVRSTHVYGPGCRWLEEMTAAVRRPVSVVVGSGRQRLAPVFLHDLVEVLAAADDREVDVRGTFGLQGPDVLTADEMVDLVAGRPKRTLHLSPRSARRAARLLGRRVSPAALEVLAADSLADAPDAAAEFGVRLTPIRQGLAAR